MSTEFEKSKNELEEIRRRFDIFEFNDKKFQDMKASAFVKNCGLFFFS